MADPPRTYPFPSNVHILSCVTLKLTYSNYLLWKTQFESLLSSQKLLGFVNGATVPPPTTHSVNTDNTPGKEPNPKYDDWVCSDQLVRSWLFGTLSEEVLGSVHTLSTSREVWLSLAENFNKSSLSREFSLRRSLQLISKKDKSLSVYCREFKKIYDSLNAIGKPIDESMKIFGFLNGLTREYDPIATVIQSSLTKFPAPTFNDVVSEVQGYDVKLQSYEETPTVTPHAAFQLQQNNAPSYNQTRGRGRGFYQNCGRGGYSNRGRGYSQHQSTSNTSGTRPTCQICGGVDHTALKCYNRFDNNYQASDVTQAFNALQMTDENGRDWYPDSGASAHVTASTNSLQTITPYAGNDTIMVADGTYLPITHVGVASLALPLGSIPLNEVRVCPDIKQSLLSVSKLCDDYPCGVFFDAKQVCVIDLTTQKVVTKGIRRKGLYVLENPNLVALYSNRQREAPESVWHHRLGHANYKILRHLQHSKEITVNKSRSNLICEPCQMGKISRLQFLPSSSVVLQPLERVHCDLWGASPVVSNQGFKYYDVFVDAYSRFSWFYPLRNKSEFYSVFISFYKMVENQLSTKLKSFQSDEGGEFVNRNLSDYLAQNGIRHLISCPHTPEQNGTAERKHRHLVELSLSMMYHSHVPLSYLVEAFNTSNVISNMLPSSSLQNKSPNEVLLKQKQTTLC